MGACLLSTKTALTLLHSWSGFYHPAFYNKWPTAFADIPALLFIVYIKHSAPQNKLTTEHKYLYLTQIYHIDCMINFGKDIYPDSKFHGANMGPTWVMLAPWTLLSG